MTIASQQGGGLPPWLYRPLPPGEPSRVEAAWAPILARRNVPQGNVPYSEWSRLVDDACRMHGITLARPTDLTERLQRPHPLQSPLLSSQRLSEPWPVGAGEQGPTIETLLRYQEAFYADRYQDPAFVFDRATLHLPEERVAGILAGLRCGEVNYPLIVATPPALSEKRKSPPKADSPLAKKIRNRQSPPPTLHRFLVDTLLRAHNIPLWQRSDPALDTFLEQVRDLTLADLTRTDLRGADGTPLTFDADGWLQYLQALYPTLSRPTVTPSSVDIGFVAWERDLPASRVIPPLRQGSAGQASAQASRGGNVTIQNRSQVDAVTFRYPLITPSRHLALFAQYLAATGEHLDTETWSWTFGAIDPKRFPDGPGVGAYWSADKLFLYRDDPACATANSRLRCSR